MSRQTLFIQCDSINPSLILGEMNGVIGVPLKGCDPIPRPCLQPPKGDVKRLSG